MNARPARSHRPQGSGGSGGSGGSRGAAPARPGGPRRRRRLLLVTLAIAVPVGLAIALPVAWALTARPVPVPDPAERLHAVARARSGGDAAAAAAGWAEATVVLEAHARLAEATRTAAAARGLTEGLPTAVQVVTTVDAAPAARRAVVPGATPDAADAVRTAILARLDAMEAEGLPARLAALGPATPTVDDLRAMGIGASPMPVITPGGRAFRTLARDLAAIAWRRAEGGDVDGAIEVVAALGRLADLAELPPLLVRTLIGAAVRQTAFDVAEELVTRDGLDAGQLARLAGHLDDLAGTSLAAGLAGERVLLESVLLGAYDDGGRLLPAELTARLVPGTPPPTGLARLANLPGLFAPRRPAVEAQLEAAFALPAPDGAAEASATSGPAPGRAAAAAAAAGRAADVLRGNLPPILIDLVAPSLEAVGRAATEWEAAFRVARLAVAVRRHERRTGELPDDLDELELPAVAGGGGGASAASGDLRLDPRTGDAFVYERTPEAPGFRIRPAGAERPTAPDPLAQP